MFHMNVPKYLWGDVVFTTSYLINRMPSKVLQYTTPLECNFFFLESPINLDLPLKSSTTLLMCTFQRNQGLNWTLEQKCVFLLDIF